MMYHSGVSNEQVADFLGISRVTLNSWRERFPEFLYAMKQGRLPAVVKLVSKIFDRATGYSHESVKIMQHEGKSYEHKFIEHYPPDTAAGVFLLKNWEPGLYRDKAQHEHSGPDGGPIEVSTLTAEQCLALSQKRGLIPKVQ